MTYSSFLLVSLLVFLFLFCLSSFGKQKRNVPCDVQDEKLNKMQKDGILQIVELSQKEKEQILLFMRRAR